jgi:Skp family chaperone for outer membrane proteins
MKKLNELTPPELILLQKHIELGKDHLIEVLGKKGFQDFLQFGRPSQKMIDQIKTNDTETSGNLILAVNTIITGTFGGWMGFSAMMELNLASPFVFGMVLSLATLVGAAIGYQSFHYTRQAAIQTGQTLQVLQLESEILREIRKKREDEVHEIQAELCVAVNALSPSRAKVSIAGWTLALNGALDEKIASYQSHPAYSFLKKEIALIKARMQKNFEEGCSEKEVSHPRGGGHKRDLPPVIEQLIRSYPRESKASKSWIRRNSRLIFTSLTPVLFGGFGSLFVYLGGTTQIAKAFECNSLVAFLSSPQAKSIKIAIAIVVTLYFGFSFLYGNRKNHKRSMEIEKKKEEIVNEESSLTLLDEKLFKFRQVHEDGEKIREMFLIADEK